MLDGIVKVRNGKVSARELHEKLILEEGRKERFSQWFNRHLQYGFEEDIDYVGCKKIYTANQYGGEQELQDYSLTIEMAKELCMLQKSDKGREIRKYFIDCEKYILETKQYNSFLDWRENEAKETHELHQSIDDDGKCIGLNKTIKSIVAYQCNFKYIYSKELLFQSFLRKENKDAWLYYLEIKDKAESYIDAFKALDSKHYMSNVITALKNNYIENIDSYNQYIKEHECKDEFTKCGFGRPKLE